MFSEFDIDCMATAIRLARQGWYTARPNPRVGCVLARDGEVVGQGWHRRAGEPHAEIRALADAGDRAAGATAYVTLEPCNHSGRTGPCSQALIEAGIGELVYGMRDPNRDAAGGLELLTDAGLKVRGPLLAEEARELNPGFIKRCRTGLPRVVVKLAASLDGRTAMASGESQWITGTAARRDVQRLRAGSGAVITGIGSVLRDDPSLNVRERDLDLGNGLGNGLENAAEIAAMQPIRVVVDSMLRMPPDAKMLGLPGEVLVATSGTTGDITGARVIPFPAVAGGVDLRALLLELANRGCNDVLVEAGARLAGAFVTAGLVDELVIYLAPKFMGSLARPLLNLALENMEDAVELRIMDIRMVGGDIRIVASPLQNTITGT